MYAVIKTGGKQYRVAEGDKVDVELLHADIGGEVTFTPVLVVDEAGVTAAADALSGASVKGTVVGEAKGPKIQGLTYKNKTNSRRHWGHRQHYTTVEVTKIVRGGGSASTTPAVAGAEEA